LWGEIATQLLLAAAPSCSATRSCCALQLHSFEQLLVVVMREQLTVPRAARRNFGTHSFDSCLPMTLFFFVNVAVGELGTPCRGHIHATAAQRNVCSNQLNAHLSDAASRKRVVNVCSSGSAEP